MIKRKEVAYAKTNKMGTLDKKRNHVGVSSVRQIVGLLSESTTSEPETAMLVVYTVPCVEAL